MTISTIILLGISVVSYFLSACSISSVTSVIVSIEIAKSVLSYLRQFDATQYDLEVHVDVGTNGTSSKMIQEVVGMVRANNLEAKTKPESYAASSVADRYI